MAIYPLKFFLLFFTLCLFSACHLVVEEDNLGIGLAPDPIFNNKRNLVILSPTFPPGATSADYIWLGTVVDSNIYNYVQFLNTLQADITNIVIENEKDIWDFYGMERPNTKKKKEILNQLLEDNKKHWLRTTPDQQEEIIKRYTVPEELDIKVIKGTKRSLEYIDNGDIILQSSFLDDSTFKVVVYDALLERNLDSWTVQIPKGITRGADVNEEKVSSVIKKEIQNMITRLMKKDVFEVLIPEVTADLSVFIDNKLVLSPSIFLSKGIHQVYIAQLGKIIYGGNINIQDHGSIDIKDMLEKQKGQILELKTNPEKVPIFINEQYVGLSPVRIKLPEGVHYIRTSNLGYSHLNYILKSDSYYPTQELTLNLSKNDESYQKYVENLKNIKLATFYSGIISFSVFLYSFERMGFYESKASQDLNREESIARYNQFAVLGYGAAALGGAFIITSLIMQILEYNARDIGIGIGDDGNLSFIYQF